MIKETLLKLTSERFQQLHITMETLRDSDDILGTFLRVHLISEGIMEALIRICFKEDAEALLSINLTYKQKLEC